MASERTADACWTSEGVEVAEEVASKSFLKDVANSVPIEQIENRGSETDVSVERDGQKLS